jgi:hypothetical protein
MNVNKYKFTIPTDDKYINIPVEIKWDFYGRDDSIEEYQTTVIKDVIGFTSDYEILRFSHVPYFYNNSQSLIPQTAIYKTQLTYEFNFFSGNPASVTTNTPPITSSNWVSSYLDTNGGFLPTQIYYYEKPFTKSFFKLDFYDTNTGITQTNYFTVILPVQQGLTETSSVSSLLPDVQIKKPTMNLDFVGDKEGFFLYWLRKRNFLNIDTFYMTAKFFDGRIGSFITMMTVDQTSPLLTNRFQFDESKFFYYKVVLNYNDYTYKIFDVVTGSNVPIHNIKWYEYVEPQ